MNEKYVTEIDLVNMIIYILKKWKVIIIIGIFGIALLTGYKYFEFAQFDKMSDEEKEKAYESIYNNIEKYSQDIKELELENEKLQNGIDISGFFVNQQIEYIDNSLRMQINPVEEYYKSVSYIVSIEEINIDEYTRDPVDEILSIYAANILEGIDYKSLEEKYNTNKKYIQELISVNINYTGNMISIYSIGFDEDMADNLEAAVITSMESYYTEINSFFPHNMFMISEDSGMRMDTELLIEKFNIINDINENNNISSLNMLTIEENNIKLEKLVKELESYENTLKNKTVFTLSHIIKYSCIGFIIGIILSAMVYCAKYVLAAKLYSESDIKNMGIEVLGVQWTEKKNKGIFAGIDNYIDRLSGRVNGKNEEYLSRVCGFLSVSGDIKRLAVISSVEDLEKSFDIASSLKKYLPQTDITVTSDFANSSNGIKSVCEADCCVMVEWTNKSKISNIIKIIEDVEKLEKKIYGAIVIKE